ncbi:MAG: GIY-YIG nuclease family protein [Lewinella sp.]|nr:GIY-YIG nuclease family protein [Lewinella sp.]
MAAKPKRFAIVDLETTGGRPARDRVMEVGIVLFEDGRITGTYSSLINPETYIPGGISEMTKIYQDDVKDAPLFHQVAREIVEYTQDRIFVAHNVRFDYGFLREEFSRLGYTFSRKQLCTVRLSRKAFPGLPSYSLENLIHHFGIPTEARHRALADALATTELLQRILEKETAEEQIRHFVDMGIKASKLPKGITLDQVHDLPEACGVYYFHDEDGDVVYVGKSINIKKRIADHFADQTSKGRRLQEAVADVSYEVTGSELVALLLESHEIKRLSPKINRALRRKTFPFAVYAYYNKEGFLCFNTTRNTVQNREKYDVISEYPTLSQAKGRLNFALRTYELCARFCHLSPGRSGACFQYHLKQCRGACAGEESVEDYNARAEQARERMKTVFDQDFLLIDQGRASGEYAVVLVRDGLFRGFGFVEEDDVQSVDSLLDAVKTFPRDPDTARIIQRFMADHPRIRTLPL